MKRKTWLVVIGFLGCSLLQGCTFRSPSGPTIVSPTPFVKPTATQKTSQSVGVATSVSATPSPSTTNDAKIGQWRIFPTSVSTVGGEWYGSKPREGYKFIKVGIALENTGFALELLNHPSFLALGRITSGAGQGFTFQVQADGGFIYHGDINFIGDRSFGVRLPPKYRLAFNGIFEVPLNATGLRLLVTPVQSQYGNPQTAVAPVVWSLTEFTSETQYLPQDTSNLKKLGAALEQAGVVSITPLKAGLWRHCSNGSTWWDVYLQLEMKNNYGYNLSISNIVFQVLDNQGGAYQLTSDPYFDPFSTKDRGIRDPYWSSLKVFGDFHEVAPGFSSTGLVGGGISEGISGAQNSSVCNRAVKWEPQPKNLRLLVLLPAIYQPRPIKEVWAIYELTDLADIGQDGNTLP